MRITNSMMTMNLLANINKNLTKMSKKQDELATGKKIHTASDDPVLAAKVLARRTDLSELEQYSKNTNDALGWMEVTEKALEDNGNIFQKIRELTVQAANGTNTADDTQKIKLEIENMKEQLVANGNSTFAGRYIFSGFETDKKFLNDDGTFLVPIDDYSLSTKPVVKYEIGVGQSINVMTSGIDIYGTVPETNIMTETFPSGTTTGVASNKSKITGDFNLNTTYAANELTLVIGAGTYDVDETALDGSIKPIDKQKVIDTFKAATGGSGTLGDDANIYFDRNDKLIIEPKAFGAIAMTMAAAVSFTPVISVGLTTTEAVVNNASSFVDPLSADDLDILKNNDISVVINGVSRMVRPSPDSTITDVASYVAEMNIRLDDAFGSDLVDVTDVAGVLTFTTKNTNDSVKPTLIVDFPRVHKSQLIEDLDELLGYLEVADHDNISKMLTVVDKHMDNMLSLRADIGARTNRMELTLKKIDSNNVSFTKMLSDAEDADMSEVIMQLKNAENVYKASLSTGARVIQPSLIDFLR